VRFKQIHPRPVQQVLTQLISQRMKNYIEHQEDNNVNEDVSFDMWLGQYASPKLNQDR